MMNILILVLSLVFSVYSKSLATLSNEANYAIIFDAGSKGTRLYLYRYSSGVGKSLFDIEVSNLDYSIDQILYCELNDDGLSSYPENTDQSTIERNFSECMTMAENQIPSNKKSTTFISLIATAGLRLLQFKNKQLVERILNEIRVYFRQSGFFYKSDSQVRIISGAEEGIFAMLAVNYLKQELSSGAFNPNLYGIIDLGGASAQLAFLPKAGYSNSELIKKVRIQSSTYDIYSHSYLCYGTAQILTMYSAFNIRNFNYANTLLASCYPSGYDFTYTGQEILDTPCINGAIFDQSYSFTIDTSSIDPKKTYTVSGNSKRNKCREELTSLLPSKVCQHDSCGIDGIYQPSVANNRYLALGNVFEAIDLTNRLLDINVQNNLTAFDEATHNICQKTYKELRALNELNNAGIGKNRIAKLCLEHNYILNLFKMYGIKDLVNVDAVEKIDDKKVNWILGLLIFELNSLDGLLN